MADWYDGKPAMTIGEAFACATRMPRSPDTPSWENDKPVYTSNYGGIYELLSIQDRIMHTHTMSGHCFVWNAPNQKREDGFRLFTYRSNDGWARVSILTHELDSLIAGTGSRMYCGNWRKLQEERGARLLNGVPIVLLDYDMGYFMDGFADAPAMKADVLTWYQGLAEVKPPAPTEEELARKIERH